MRISTLLLALILAIPAAAQGRTDFARDVLPILQRSCFNCHQVTKRDARGRLKKAKGSLRLDGAGLILKGGTSGRVLVPGYPDKSSLYTRTALPEDHEDIMPAKGDPLTAADQGVLKRWIAEGGSFGKWTGAAGPVKNGKGAGAAVVRAGRQPARVQILVALAKGASQPSPTTVARVRGTDAQISPVFPGSPLLTVDFVAHEDTANDKRVGALAKLSANITELNLAKTRITNRTLGVIARMPRLTRLDLHDTTIDDAGVARLSGMKELRSLNLYGTDVSDKSIQVLATLPRLANLYLWQTKVTEDGAARLAAAMPNTKIVRNMMLPPPAKPREGGNRRRRKNN